MSKQQKTRLKRATLKRTKIGIGILGDFQTMCATLRLTCELKLKFLSDLQNHDYFYPLPKYVQLYKKGIITVMRKTKTFFLFYLQKHDQWYERAQECNIENAR